MKRGRTFLRRLLWTLGVLLALGIPLYLFVLPWYVHRQIIAALADEGIAGAQLEVVHVSPWKLDLANLRLGDVARADGTAVEARFSPGRLWNKRIESVRFTGLELSIGLAGGRLEAGPLTQDFAATRPATGPAKQDASAPQGLRIPVARVELVSSFLTLRLPARSVRLPVAGTLSRRDDRRYAVDLRVAPENQDLHLTGTIGPASDEMELTLAGEAVDAALLGETISAACPGTIIRGGGFLRLEDVRLRNTMGRLNIGGRIKPDSASIGLKKLDGTGIANFVGVTGVYSIRAAFGPDNPGGRATITVSDAGFSGKSWGIDVEGLNGKVVFADLNKFRDPAELRTDGLQTITVAKVSIGDVKFTNGTLKAAMNTARSIVIDETRWSCFDGTLSARGLQLDLTKKEPVSLAFQVDNADVRQILGMLAPQRLSGNGRVSGQLAARVNWPHIRIDPGELHGSPGGTLEVKDFSAMAEALGPGVSADERVKKKVFEAMGNFKYDVLKVELKRTSKGLSAHMDIVGRGQTGDRQALHVEPTINGLDPVLDLVLGLQQRMSHFGQTN